MLMHYLKDVSKKYLLPFYVSLILTWFVLSYVSFFGAVVDFPVMLAVVYTAYILTEKFVFGKYKAGKGLLPHGKAWVESTKFCAENPGKIEASYMEDDSRKILMLSVKKA